MGFGRWGLRDANPYNDRTINNTNGAYKIVYVRYRTGSSTPVWVAGDCGNPSPLPTNGNAPYYGVASEPNSIFTGCRYNTNTNNNIVGTVGFNPYISAPTNITTVNNGSFNPATNTTQTKYLLEISFNKHVNIKKVYIYRPNTTTDTGNTHGTSHVSLGYDINSALNDISGYYQCNGTDINERSITTASTDIVVYSGSNNIASITLNTNPIYTDKVYIKLCRKAFSSGSNYFQIWCPAIEFTVS